MGKKEWIKWKKMLSAVSRSNMRIQTLVDLVVYPIFQANGLFDQLMAFKTKEVTALKTFIKTKKVWDFNMKMPSNCNATADPTVNGTCKHIRDWVTVRGVSDDAADMHNFRVKNESNVSLAEIDS